jgi:hypothetical protein
LTRKKEIDRDRILDAAESVILDSGGRTFTLDAVAERAGISKGGLGGRTFDVLMALVGGKGLSSARTG